MPVFDEPLCLRITLSQRLLSATAICTFGVGVGPMYVIPYFRDVSQVAKRTESMVRSISFIVDFHCPHTWHATLVDVCLNRVIPYATQ